jgi:hypothetical protein
MKYFLLAVITLGTISLAAPSHGQFNTGSDNCANVCVKFDVQSGSVNNLDSFGFNNSSSSPSGGNIRWQIGVTWRPNAPEVAQAEAERTKQRLDDNRSLIVALAEAIAQNKTELARGIAIILAPRLNYSDPRILIAELKEGSIPREFGNGGNIIPGDSIIEVK